MISPVFAWFVTYHTPSHGIEQKHWLSQDPYSYLHRLSQKKRLTGKQTTKWRREEQKLTGNAQSDLWSDLNCTWISSFFYIMVILITPSTWKNTWIRQVYYTVSLINKNNDCAITIAFLCNTNKNLTSRTTCLPDGFRYLHFRWRNWGTKSQTCSPKRLCLKVWVREAAEALWLLLQMLITTPLSPLIPLSTFLVLIQLHHPFTFQ